MENCFIIKLFCKEEIKNFRVKLNTLYEVSDRLKITGYPTFNDGTTGRLDEVGVLVSPAPGILGYVLVNEESGSTLLDDFRRRYRGELADILNNEFKIINGITGFESIPFGVNTGVDIGDTEDTTRSKAIAKGWCETEFLAELSGLRSTSDESKPKGDGAGADATNSSSKNDDIFKGLVRSIKNITG